MQRDPLLVFPPGCREAFLVRRIKRFFVECASPSGPLWAHTNNSGAMTGLLRPGAPVLLSPALKEGRKLSWTLELIGLPDSRPGRPLWGQPGSRIWAGVNTLTPNRLLRAAFERGLLPWAGEYTAIKPEARRGQSRLDALFTAPGRTPLWVECKNVSLVEEERAAFPDATSARAHKHLREMMDIVRSGERAAFFYCIQRPDARCFGPADYVDSVYTTLFMEAAAVGVESYAYLAYADEQGIRLGQRLPVSGVS